MAAYLECLPSSARAAIAMPVPPQIPIVILSAATANEAELAERTSWIAGREHAQHIQVPNTGHWLQLERPELVAGVVRDTLLRVR
jgi:pimeloyl-ACP methyl ester carboxylesterase